MQNLLAGEWGEEEGEGEEAAAAATAAGWPYREGCYSDTRLVASCVTVYNCSAINLFN